MALKISSGEGTKSAELAPTSVGVVSVKDRYDINMDSPMPVFDSPPAFAFKATTRRDKRDLIALICDPKLPPRIDVIPTMQRVDQTGTLRLVDWDIVDWAPENRRCPVILFERPHGGRVFPSKDQSRTPLSEDMVTRNFLQNAVVTLHDLHTLNETHRAIRPENLFFADELETQIVLGECVSSPSAVMQPLVCETIENCLSAPGGRGEGSKHHDMYSLGVCVLALLTGQYPCRTILDDQLIRDKFALGSYAAIVRQNRVSLTMMEVLRGLLNDDMKERWTIDDLALWIDGRRLSPKQQVLPGKATRPFVVNEQEYQTARELAYGFWRHWDHAAEPIIDGSLDGWLRRSLGDESKIDAVNLAKAAGELDKDRLTARTIIALDPGGPIRLRDLATTVGGMGAFIGIYADDAEARNLFAQAVTLGLTGFWMEQQLVTRPENVVASARIEKARATLVRGGLGYGLERVIHDLNENYPCRSPIFERDYVPTLEHLLPALERAAEEQGENLRRLVDRDIAAFIGSNFRRAISAELRDMDAPDPATRIIGQIRLLGMVQEAVDRQSTLTHLCRAAARLSKPAVDRFNSRELRKRAFTRLAKAVKGGKLGAMLEMIDNPRELELDARAFKLATNEYTKSVADSLALERDIADQDKIAGNVGGQISSGLAGLLATMIFVVAALVRLI